MIAFGDWIAIGSRCEAGIALPLFDYIMDYCNAKRKTNQKRLTLDFHVRQNAVYVNALCLHTQHSSFLALARDAWDLLSESKVCKDLFNTHDQQKICECTASFTAYARLGAFLVVEAGLLRNVLLFAPNDKTTLAGIQDPSAVSMRHKDSVRALLLHECLHCIPCSIVF